MSICDRMDSSPPSSSVHGILQARILEWVAMPSSRGSSQPRDPTEVSTFQADSLPSKPPGKIEKGISQFSHSVVSDALWPHEPQHARLPVHHQLLEFTQTHVHWIGDAIQPSHPLSSPSPPALNLSQHQGLFKWVSSSHQVAQVLEFQLQHQSFQWTTRTDLL